MRLLSAVLLWLLLPWTAQAGKAVTRVDGPGDAVRVVAHLQTQLDALGAKPVSLALAGTLWKTYSQPLPDRHAALAGQILLQVVERPESLPVIAAALEKVPGGAADETILHLSLLTRSLQDSPQTLSLLQDFAAPLRKILSQKTSRGPPSEELQPLLDALFEGRHLPKTAGAEIPVELHGTGAGSRSFGLKPGHGGVELSAEPVGKPRGRAKKFLALAEPLRLDGPRVLGEPELQRLLEGRGRPSYTLAKGRRAAGNFRRAARRVNAWVRQGKDLELGMLLELNRLLRAGVPSWKGAAAPGKLRTAPFEKAWNEDGWYYARPARVVDYLADFLVWYHANKTAMPPIQLAAMAYQQLVRIHPFGDANGRTTRLAMDFILQRGGYLPASFLPDNGNAVNLSTRRLIANVAQGVVNSAEELSR